ncbi:MAG: hypothetical protein NZ899_11210 [Thermoguttaceae bacterium]|nr:hypothetical protein [Thermoguttaceae bacterium]MDW8077761.1 hypothetical protein [Thermoguttaceae bacterium]
MKILRQIYFCGVSGALGALVAWLVVGWTNPASWRHLWLSNAFVGGSLGGLITIALVCTRGWVQQWTYSRILRTVRNGFICGSIGGAVGLILGQVAFMWIGGEWLGRGVGWGMLGLLVGLGQSLGDPSVRRCAVGAGGGAAAGLFAGWIYEILTQLFLFQSVTAQLWASSFGLMAVGGILAAGIPFAEKLAARGVLVVLSGQRRGTEHLILDKLLVGRSESCQVVISDDGELEPEQLALEVCPEGIRVSNVGQWRSVLVKGETLPPGAAAVCPSGALIHAGKTGLRVL